MFSQRVSKLHTGHSCSDNDDFLRYFEWWILDWLTHKINWLHHVRSSIVDLVERIESWLHHHVGHASLHAQTTSHTHASLHAHAALHAHSSSLHSHGHLLLLHAHAHLVHAHHLLLLHAHSHLAHAHLLLIVHLHLLLLHHHLLILLWLLLLFWCWRGSLHSIFLLVIGLDTAHFRYAFFKFQMILFVFK